MDKKKNKNLLLDIIGFCYDIYNGKYETKEEYDNAIVKELTPLRKALGL